MIVSAEEFIRLRKSSDPEEYRRAAHEEASNEVWLQVIKEYPEMKKWVIHNKSIPVEILDHLSKDIDPEVRRDVAAKRKIMGTVIFERLSKDKDENVRLELLRNRKLSVEMLRQINSSGSDYFEQEYKEKLTTLKT